MSPPSLSPAASSIYSWLRVLFWLAAALGLAWLLFRYRVAILAFLRSVWAAIRSFITALLGLIQPSVATAPTVVSKVAQVPPFRTFKNPFLTGGDQLWSPEKLITYSYDALQSWALEDEAAHGSPKTPREFCRQLAEEMPAAADAFEHLAFLYGHVAYGSSVPAIYNPEHLRLIWEYMSGPRPKRSIVQMPDEDLAGKV
jgi:hypothetical protein